MSVNLRRRQDNDHNNVKVQKTSTSDDDNHEESNLNGDYLNIAILFFLYLLQGIPIGITAAIPMLLQNRGASYKQQAEFSFAHWPFSIKLLWAPIVDSLYWSKFGRRKSWLIPIQYLIGLAMLIISSQVDQWLGGDGISPNIKTLTMIFFCLNFLAATQDIAVDGWALTMLKRNNVAHASTCNSVGQTAGYFLGYVTFMALESSNFCNLYLRSEQSDEGLVTLPGFLWFWGVVFMTTTTLVALFKKENENRNNKIMDNAEPEAYQSISETYTLLLEIIKMKPIQILAGVLMTVKIAFAASDAVTSLKLVDAGVPKDKLALLVIPLVPLQILLPLSISRYTSGPKPMTVYVKAIPYRLIFSMFAPIIVYITPYIITDHNIPYYYYIILLVNYAIYQVTLYSMFVAVMAFFARISDPFVGGTYMTLLNTVCNLGGNWPTTIVLWLVDVLTWRKCVNPTNITISTNNTCSNHDEQMACADSGGTCKITIDGYYIECIICIIYGIFWYLWGKSKIEYLQRLPNKDWLVKKQHVKKNIHDHKS